MIVKVYVWETTATNPGHASLEFDGQYVSFWPVSENSAVKDTIKNPPGKGNLKDFKLGVTHNVKLSNSYALDMRLERKAADHTILLKGMDVPLMTKQWKAFSVNPQRYNMQNSNCSTVVATFLEAGSGVKYSKIPKIEIDQYITDPVMQFAYRLRYLGNSIKMWTPRDVHQYAKEIQLAKV